MSQSESAIAGIRRVAVLRNPLKPKERIDRYVSIVRDASREVSVEVIDTADRDDLVRQTNRAAHGGGHDLIVVAGGDGTLLHVLQGLGEADVLLSLLPLGTSNDYAKAIGITSVEQAARALFHGSVVEADRGVCSFTGPGGEARRLEFCSTAGVGLMAWIFRFERFGISQALKRLIGDAVWPILTVPAILLSGRVGCELHFDGRAVQTRLNMLEVSKVARAGGTVFAPLARLDGGAFDAWLVRDAGRLRTSQFMIATLRGEGRHLRVPGFEYFTREPGWNGYGAAGPRRLEVVTRNPLPLHVHGDFVGFTPATFAIRPRPLRVLAAE